MAGHEALAAGVERPARPVGVVVERPRRDRAHQGHALEVDLGHVQRHADHHRRARPVAADLVDRTAQGLVARGAGAPDRVDRPPSAEQLADRAGVVGVEPMQAHQRVDPSRVLLEVLMLLANVAGVEVVTRDDDRTVEQLGAVLEQLAIDGGACRRQHRDARRPGRTGLQPAKPSVDLVGQPRAHGIAQGVPLHLAEVAPDLGVDARGRHAGPARDRRSTSEQGVEERLELGSEGGLDPHSRDDDAVWDHGSSRSR